jgi:hypothetical protein
MNESLQTLTGDAMVVRNEGLMTAEVEGEVVAMGLDGSCYGLRGVGARIWALIAEPRSVDSLCDQLLREYDVEEEVCRREVFDLLEDLRSGQLVTVEAP